jgi:hypothetical protein
MLSSSMHCRSAPPVRSRGRSCGRAIKPNDEDLALTSVIIALSHVALTTGTTIGPYEIVALLGAGGVGEVCRATGFRSNAGNRSHCACTSSAPTDRGLE